MFKKMFAAIGLGGASVDAVLDTPAATPGATLTGRVNIRGGSVAQEIRSIELSVETEYLREHDDHKVTHTHSLGRYRIPRAVTVEPNGSQEIPFEVEVPWGTPLTVGSQQVWLKTSLEIEGGVDPTDRDAIRVEPSPLQARLLEAMQLLGFGIRNARCEHSRLGRGVPFVQEIEMRPGSGPFRGRLDEVDVITWAGPGTLEVIFEVDRKARGLGSLFAEMLEMDESRLRMNFTDADLAHPASEWARDIQHAIESHA